MTTNWSAWNKGAAARKSSGADLSSYDYKDVVETEVNESLPSGAPKPSKEGFSDYANMSNSILTGLGSTGGNFLAGLGAEASRNKYNDSFSESEQATQAGVRKGLEAIPGWGQLISLGSGAVDAIGAATGTNLSSIDTEDAERAGVKGSWFNKTMNSLPGNSMIWGGLSALFGNNRTHSLAVTDEARAMTNGYGATIGDLNAAENLSNKRLFFGQTKQANDFINSQRENQRIMTEIGRVNTQRKQSDYYQDLQHQNINRYAGQNYLGMTIGKQGMKLMSIREAKEVLKLRKKVVEEENVESFKEGGSIPGIDTSILPEGALHARKNNLSEINPELEDVTKKGIPVVAENGGEIQEQIAEIEENEIIFRLEVTKKIEELMKDGSDEAMIECGKIVTYEIIDNTEDNTGQIIEEVQNEE